MNARTAPTGRMGRPKEFSEAEALDRAMHVFWEKGFEGTSLDDLTAAMRINRSSLYSTFGDKETLFRRVIERYKAGPMTFIAEALQKPSARQVIEGLLRSTARFLSDAAHPRGCLSLQGGLTCGTGAEGAKQTMINWRNHAQIQLEKRMQRAQAAGDLPKDISPKDLARYVMVVVNGLAVQAANGAGGAELNRAVELALRSMPV
jgi:AcrR family transcriptional regulator